MKLEEVRGVSYQIKLEVFEGPMDLLLHLIQKNQVSIYDIPIAKIAEQYIESIYHLQQNNLETISEFVVMAAHLLEIKSKMLLPKSNVEEKLEEDPREELVEKLLQYQRIKELTGFLKLKEEEAEKVLYKFPEAIEKYLIDEELDDEPMLTGLSLQDIFHAFQKVLDRNEKKIDKVRSSFNKISKDLFTVEEKMEELAVRLKQYKSIKFLELFKKDTSKLEIVIAFLALLELIKQRKVSIEQSSVFEEIIIRDVVGIEV